MSATKAPNVTSLDAISGESRFQILVGAVKDYAIYLLDVNGHVASWNSGAQRFKGYTEDEIIGRHFSVFYTEEDRAAGLPARALRMAAEGRFEAEGWRVRRDGTRFWTSVVIDPVINDRGDLIGYAKVTRDITEKRDAQLELERSREALSQAQKMEAVGRLTGGVAHDFNNLLTVIRSSVDLLKLPNLSEDRRQRYINAISETADRAATLTRQLLAFARRQPLQPEVFSVADRLRGLTQIIDTTVGSPIDVVFDIADDIGTAEADPNQFETAVLNMVINARDAMGTGGRLTIRARNVDVLPQVRSHAAAQAPFVTVAIEDTGTGIDADTLSRIFEPFFTTKGVNQGTGLGLSQVYGFAKQSGGEIDVTSEPGKGSTFTLYLPRVDAAQRDASATAAAPEPSADLSAGSILLVEDNETVGRFAESLLEELGQRVTWATHGREALDILDMRAPDFDLVFSDVVMPGMSGIELAKEIRARWPDMPVVLTSGYSHVIAEEGSHGFELVEKPYSVDAIARILGRRRSGHTVAV